MNDHPPSPQTRRRNTSDAGSTPASLTVLVIDDRDERTALPVDEPRWIALASAVLADLGPAGAAELAISFVDEPAIAELNERFMGHEGPTDVLSFPIDDTPPPVEVAELPRLLGDIVICPGVAARNAPQHAGTFEDEIALLVVHGILHLLGMDHEVDDDRVVMQQRERELLTAHHGSPARDPWS